MASDGVVSDPVAQDRTGWRTLPRHAKVTLASLLCSRKTALRAQALSIQESESEGGSLHGQSTAILGAADGK